ncbi:Clan MH, family M20, peptidase T-like metallopeptidase [Trichomonas vaginalis G3]|uniref:Clan MH, family M20, peptidase T-like metallopeptidase n=1 Tax=Trichomonas vaginalis (strain ATCC PRA-98 / G3) TaxID=412133 RepID=A2EEP6_TRIV3|nr:Clan MH, family M20, peptidase T-like metallopeptidase [Trichomonas vaginalis G3]EAY08852.1 Clan MH, family M20, peptidase T-like metallopeptidase [Trichomonas vaginalis G3]KAI5489347.1 Clan MH, family M20, peptidase T-like metallopeptidase [Trichomonas vaginalis G3]|eukprot:XP_001321075.1 Clan MH, family M20, peptidase T-like metallopeptidase [Trichomonas vaginalis G3]
MNAEILNDAIELRHELHTMPELSGKEVKTKKRLMEFLSQKTNLEIVDRGFWFYAVYKAQNPKGSIAFRADFDAIGVTEKTNLPYCSKNPEAAHKCGHDGHSSTLAAFARVISQEGSDKDIYFIFQNAEETGEGGEPASMLLEEKRIQNVFAVHNCPGIKFGNLGLINGTVNCASKGLIIKFHGIPSHASEPEKGRNPSFAIGKTVLEVDNFLRERNFKGITLATVIQIKVGERTFGVSAFEGELLYTLRGEHENEYEELENKVKEFCEKNAEEYGLTVDYSYSEPFPATVNHDESVDFLRKLAKEENFEVHEMKEPIRASEDFGYYLRKTKGALIWIGAGENHPSLHSADFDFNDKLIPVVVRLFKAIVDKI